jgi:hypothetical protein
MLRALTHFIGSRESPRTQVHTQTRTAFVFAG